MTQTQTHASRLRRGALTLTAAGLVLGGFSQAGAATAPRPQVTDPGGDSLTTKAQDIKSVLFRTTGTGARKALTVTFTTWSPVMNVAAFNYEVDATTTCGTLQFSMSPSTAYQTVTGLNGWITNGCDKGASDLVHATVVGRDITWSLPVDSKVLPAGTVFKDFEARIDVANPALPFPSSQTQTAMGLVDKATAKGPWKMP